MPRAARVVISDYPYHVTQRGNYQQTIFESEEDYRQYRAWLKEYSKKYALDIWAYCLMGNHVHFVCVPRNEDSLARNFNTLHMRYSQYCNKKKGVAGHLWHGRFFSCILDERHLYAAIRYVENNPVRAGIVGDPADYRWSSARGHCGMVPDEILSDTCYLCEEIDDWPAYLSDPEPEGVIETLRMNVLSGRPCGSDDFIEVIEKIVGRPLRVLPRGRPTRK